MACQVVSAHPGWHNLALEPLNLLLQSLQLPQLKLTTQVLPIHNVSGDIPAVFNNTGHHHINQIHWNAAKNSGWVCISRNQIITACL